MRFLLTFSLLNIGKETVNKKAVVSNDNRLFYGLDPIPIRDHRHCKKQGVGTVTSTVTIPSTLTVGTYYIGAIGDYTNTVKENNETNNARAGNTLMVQ